MGRSTESHEPQPRLGQSAAQPPIQPPALLTGTGPIQGLSAKEAQARRARGESNAVPLHTSRSYLQILRENVFTFINNVLYLLGLALVLLGQYTDALLSVGIVLLNVLVSVFQEVRAKRTLDHIALLTRPKATVIRDGQPQEVDPDEIVLGDVLLVRPGDQIVVDGSVVGETQMEVDESLLTGESDAVTKRPGAPISSGTFCLSGSACYIAEKVGVHSTANRLTQGTRLFRRVYTPLQREINLVIRVILLVALFFELLLIINAIVQGIPLVASVEISVVVIGLVPIGLFLAIATAYALGAVRLAGKGALVQQANSVESLSHVDVLCLDKTGTLTTNALKLHAVFPAGISESDLRRRLGIYAASTPAGNRTNEAIAAACPGETRQVKAGLPFSSAWKWSALAFDDPRMPGVYVLGAPEILRPALDSDAEVGQQAAAWEEAGLRVLLFAISPEALPLRDANNQPCLPRSLMPLGLISLSDELRPEARETLRHFAEAGIRLKIISGDHPQTVAALVKQAGLDADIKTISGEALQALDEAGFVQAAESVAIFGRVTPGQKKRLVQALRSQGHYVAMIGDGVNDVLSLKQANLGIALHGGSQAARGVADLILLNDSFGVLPTAFREGQRITNGMDTILKLFLTRVFYMALLLIATSMVGGFPFSPANNALLTFFTVGVPTIALAAWARPGTDTRRDQVRSLFHFVFPAALLLALGSLLVYLVYFIPVYRDLLQAAQGVGVREGTLQGYLAEAQSAVVTFGVLCGLLLILFVEPPTRAWVGGEPLNGDWRPVALTAVLAGGFVVVLTVPAIGKVFDVAPLGVVEYLLIGGAVIVWAVALRWVWRSRLMERFLGLNDEYPGESARALALEDPDQGPSNDPVAQ
jgi:cation-transporting ATPase E